MKQPGNYTATISDARHCIFLIIVLCFPALRSACQQSPEQILKLDKDKFNEELYVQTDRDLYISGETVFLKVFCLNRLTHKPSDISKVVYVSLLDKLNNPVVQVKIQINGFSATGHIDLPDTIGSGNYYLMSCTHWMQNFSPKLFSYKTISVINPFESLERGGIPIRESSPDTVIFFPEGGTIISGTENKVGFLCLDKKGYPVRINGVITDNRNILLQVHSDDTGYGLFSVTPESSDSLYLVPQTDVLPLKIFALPTINNHAISFSVRDDSDEKIIRVRILKSPDFDSSGRSFHIVADPVSTSPFITDADPDNKTEILIKKNTLPTGLSTIKLTDDQGHNLGERLIYNKPPEARIRITADKSEYLTREKAKLNIYVTDYEGNPAESDITVSVVKSVTKQITKSNLSSSIQLPGYVAMNGDSDYADINDQLIFYNDADAIVKPLNNLKEIPEYLPEIEGHIVRGSIRNTFTGEPLQHENIVLAFVSNPALCTFAKTDDNGCFQFIVNEPGNSEIVIQPFRPDLSDFYIDLRSPFPELINEYKVAPLFIDTSKLAGINSVIIAMQVQALYEPLRVSIKGDLIKTRTHAFYGVPDEDILLSAYIELTSLKEVIKELIPGLTTYTRKDKDYFNLIYRNQDQSTSANPFVLVDGVPVHDHDAVLKIKPEVIAQVKLLYSRYFIKDMVLEGIIDIITKKGRLEVPEFDRPVFRQEFESIQTPASFNHPDYSSSTQKESRIPDFRNTLYWNPNINTDTDGTASVEFYTSDEPGTYNIRVEGFTSQGQKACSDTVIKVK